jgi:hypothetical protein
MPVLGKLVSSVHCLIKGESSVKTFWISVLRISLLVIALIAVPRAYSQGNCAAVVQQESYNTTQGTHYFYGWASGQATVEAAVAEARKYATQKRGGETLKSDPASSDVVVKSSCGQQRRASGSTQG